MDRAIDGTIDACAHAGCGRRCCEFSHGNYIVLYPGEVREAVAAGVSLAHLEIRPSAEGGHRAICKANDKSRCDGGHKPLDCASYPFFPTAGRSPEILGAGLQSPHCPLRTEMLSRHSAWVAEVWRQLAAQSDSIRRWIRRVTLVDYEPIRTEATTLACQQKTDPPAMKVSSAD